MKRWLWAAGLMVAAALARGAWAQGLDWDIDSFAVEIEVRPDSSLVVRETIVADFSREGHRGIFREIPYRYRRTGAAFRLRLDVVSVTDGEGGARRWTREREDGTLKLRIGDPSVTLRGRQTYVIEYRVERGLLSFETHDELYWNATGTGWPVPMEGVSCTVTLPSGVESGSIRAQSYVGAYGSSNAGPEGEVGAGSVRFDARRSLRAREGLTVVVGWAPGAVEHAGLADSVRWFVRDNLIVAVPLVTAALLWLVWRVWGRDQGSAGSVVVRYEAPEGMSPLEVGTLIDERVDTRDVTAALVGLAVRGYLRIDASEASPLGDVKAKEVSLVKLREADHAVTDAERFMLSKVFAGGRTVKLSDLQHKFYAYLPHVSRKAYGALVDAGYFAASPVGVRGVWLTLGVIWAGAWIVLAVGVVKTNSFPPVPWIIAAVLAAPQVLVLAPFMPRRTAKGRRALEGVKGLEEYIVRAERRELEERAGKDGFQPHFESVLPYALALGLAEAWGEKFEGLFTPEPGWYVGPSESHFTTGMWVAHLGRTTGSMGESMSSMPRSSGSGGSSFGGGGSGFSGGFSGGGGGGGGGGAW